MNNMWASESGKGIFNMRFDFEKSHDSYIYDKNTEREYLDFFGMFSSIPIGYNHPIFSEKSFKDDIIKVSKFKIVNCEFVTDERDRFYKKFMEFLSCDGQFVNAHFCSTGALAVECAVKTAMYHSKKVNPKIVSVKNDFHGIMSYSNILTTRFFPVKFRLEKFSNNPWPNFESGDELRNLLSSDDSIAGVIVEPIQSTFGDNHLNHNFLREVRSICDEFKVPLIFDEIQTGFCVTGKTWFFEHLDIVPDIIIFGKKAQVCGILVTEEFSSIFKTKIKMLDTTWDSDLVDMVRSTYIIDTIKKDKLMEKIRLYSKEFIRKLNELDFIKNIRGVGGLIAFDFDSTGERDKFHKDLFNKGMLVNPTGYRHIRLRPHLSASEEDFNRAYKLIGETLNE